MPETKTHFQKYKTMADKFTVNLQNTPFNLQMAVQNFMKSHFERLQIGSIAEINDP